MFNLFAIIILMFLPPELRGEVDLKLISVYLIILVFLLVIHFIKQSKHKNWCRIDVFFLLGLIIVHFQWPLMLAVSGISPVGISRVGNGLEYMNYGTWLSLVGLSSWLLGYNTKFFAETDHKQSQHQAKISYKFILYFCISSFSIFLLLSGGDFLSGRVYKTGDAGDVSGAAGYFNLFSLISFLLLIAISFYNSQKEKGFYAWYNSIPTDFKMFYSIYCFIFLISGDRGALIQILIVTSIFYGVLIKPIGFFKLLIFVILGAGIVSIIGAGRGIESGGNLFIAGYQNIENSDFYSFTLELANSSRVLYKGLEYTDNGGEFLFGQLWLSKILSIIPFLQGMVVDLFELENHELGSAGFITYLTFGSSPPMGEGTSFITDIYLNFSSIGVVFVSIFFGFLCRFLSNKLRHTNNFLIVLAFAYVAAESFYFGRGTVTSLIRPIVWGGLLYYFFSLKNFSTKKRSLL